MPGHRQRQHEGVGIHPAAAEDQPPAQRNRQNEQVDQKQIERKQPDRLADMGFVHILDHQHLKLARQKQKRHHRQKSQRQPAAITAGHYVKTHQRRQLRLRRRLPEQIAGAIEHGEGDDRADQHKRHQLEQRLERHRRHHPFMTLGIVYVASAKQDRKHRQHQRHIKRSVHPYRLLRRGGWHSHLRIKPQHIETGGDSFQLDRDVRQHAQHRDDGDHAGQQAAFAIAGSDEVRNRGDAVGLGDPHDAPQHEPEQHRH